VAFAHAPAREHRTTRHAPAAHHGPSLEPQTKAKASADRVANESPRAPPRLVPRPASADQRRRALLLPAAPTAPHPNDPTLEAPGRDRHRGPRRSTSSHPATAPAAPPRPRAATSLPHSPAAVAQVEHVVQISNKDRERDASPSQHAESTGTPPESLDKPTTNGRRCGLMRQPRPIAKVSIADHQTPEMDEAGASDLPCGRCSLCEGSARDR
jgi:hypothetical protein